MGGQVGPDLTGSNRRDLDYVLSNVLDPGALIGKDYLAHIIATTDGRIRPGIIRGQQTLSPWSWPTGRSPCPRAMSISAETIRAMMPDDLWTPLSEHEVRSLVSYLASPAQVPLPAGEGGQKTP